METALLFAIVALLLVNAVLVFVFRYKPDNRLDGLSLQINTSIDGLGKFQTGLKEDFRLSREESATLSQSSRKELNDSLKEFRAEVSEVFKTLNADNTASLEKLNKTLADNVKALIEASNQNESLQRDEVAKRFKDLQEQAKNDAAQMRETLKEALSTFRESFDRNVKSFNDLQREKFVQLEAKQSELVTSTATKLEEMRATVDEKLQKTLTERIGQSFELVGKQLDSVQKGLGEMQTLAQDVGGLKKVLSNVKMRGGYGEIQLAMLLEQVLAPEQYEANVRTKAGSNDSVEFAIKLPGRDEHSSVVYLPVDAKFPKDAYERLLEAYEHGDPQVIVQAAKGYEERIKSMAKSIHDKYIDPPNTTDFAILFLPFESMYAEVLRKPTLVEALQREYKVLVVGPMNLAGLLNSLQMGFRTLAIQQRASEVWKVLGAVKTEFEKFGGMLEKTQKNLHAASNNLDQVIGTRTNAIRRKLRAIEALPAAESQKLLPDIDLADEQEEQEETGPINLIKFENH